MHSYVTCHLNAGRTYWHYYYNFEVTYNWLESDSSVKSVKSLKNYFCNISTMVP